MNDLLSFVKGGSAAAAPSGRDLEAPPPPEETRHSFASDEAAMQSFFDEVAAIKAQMADIRRLAGLLEEDHARSQTVTRRDEMHALREKMQDDINAVSKLADAVKRRLADVDRGNEAALKRKGCGPGTASERTRSAITGALKRKLKDLMGEFQSLRDRITREYRETVERRVFTVTGQHADEAQLDALIDAGEGETVFQRAIMEQGRGFVLDTIAEIRERRDAVLELEKSLMDLHQIFLDMAVLVEAQGQMLDNIEVQVARSVEHVQAGTTHLVQAKDLARKTRKWMCCALITGVIIIVIVVVVAIISTQGGGGDSSSEPSPSPAAPAAPATLTPAPSGRRLAAAPGSMWRQQQQRQHPLQPLLGGGWVLAG